MQGRLKRMAQWLEQEAVIQFRAAVAVGRVVGRLRVLLDNHFILPYRSERVAQERLARRLEGTEEMEALPLPLPRGRCFRQEPDRMASLLMAGVASREVAQGEQPEMVEHL